MRIANVVLVAALFGCGPRWVVAQPATVPARDDSLSKAVAVLVAEGDSIETKDEAAGVVVSGWSEVTQLGEQVRFRIAITVADGKVTVASQCQRPPVKGPLTTTSAAWENCGDRILEPQQAKVRRIAAALK